MSAFWWSPLRSARLAWPELSEESLTWVRLAARSGRPLLNFGDELTPLILQRITRRRIAWARPERADIVAIGSIMELALRMPTEARIWGTGLRSAEVPDRVANNLAPEAVVAVRGPMTRDLLGLSADMTLGDPGVLSALLVTDGGSATAGDLFVPHFRTWSTPDGRRSMAEARSAGMRVVPPNIRPSEMVDVVSRARFVTSSSLHGVIVAHSLGIPCRLVTTAKSAEPTFKFADFYRSCGRDVVIAPLASMLESKSRAPVYEQAADEAPEMQRMCGTLAGGLMEALESALA